MTVSTTVRKAGPFTGNGVTTVFPFAFKVFAQADVRVTELTLASGVEVVKTLTTDYTITLNSNQDTNPGGTVTANVAPSALVTWTIDSQVAETQGAAFTDAGGWYPSVLNIALDKLTVLVQQLREVATRSLKLPVSSSASAQLPTPVASQFLGWNSAASAIINYAGVASVAVSSFMATVVAAVDAAAARLALGAAASGANTDITSLASTTTINGTVIGYRDIPQNSQSAAYQFVAADAGKHILHPSADTTARTFTIPANATVAFPIGTAITIVNQNAAGVITLSITSDTMRLAGTGTTGSRSIAANGIATLLKIGTTEWIVSGPGVT